MRILPYKLFESGPKGKDLSIFVRFGGLDIKKQHGYGKDSFHAPPAPRGIYAFPKVMQELFLVGSMDVFQPGIFPKKPDYTKLSKELSSEEFNKLLKDQDKHDKEIFRSTRREFRVTTGDIWHHLGEFCKQNEIISTHNSWVKTSIKTWQKAFSKSSIHDRYGEDFGGSDDRVNKGRGKQSINDTKGLSGYYSKDHYEVFFDTKV